MISIQVSDNLLLRTLYKEDAEELFLVVDANRQHLRHWLNWIDSNTTIEHTVQFIEHTLLQQETQEGFVLGIFLNNKLVGELGISNWNHSLKKAQIGYWLANECEGKGILSRCLAKFLDFLFDNVGLNKVELHFIQQNIRSAKVAERIGCKIEGLLRQSYLRHGQLEDLVIAGLLRSDWMQQRTATSVNT